LLLAASLILVGNLFYSLGVGALKGLFDTTKSIKSE